MLKMLNRARTDALCGLFALSLAGVAFAAPAQAMKPPPQDPGSSSSTSGGSTSGGSTSGGTSVPEPSSLALFGAGAAAFMIARRRAAKKD